MKYTLDFTHELKESEKNKNIHYKISSVYWGRAWQFGDFNFSLR
jgi:hypothetical protein